MLQIGARDDDENPAEERRCSRLEREPEDEPACTTEQRGAEQHERQSPRPRHAPEQRVVQRRVRRDPVGERSDERAEQQPDDPRSEIHAAEFRGGTAGSCPLARARVPSPGGCPSLVLGAMTWRSGSTVGQTCGSPGGGAERRRVTIRTRRRQLRSTFAWALMPRRARARREPDHRGLPRDARPRRRRARRVSRSSRPRAASSSTGDSDSAHSEALRDPLTGLPNRVLLDDRIEQAFRRSRRSGEPFTLIAVDLDGFKDVNDVRGHRAGDLVLKALARRFEAIVRRVGHGRAGRWRRVRHPLDGDGERRAGRRARRTPPERAATSVPGRGRRRRDRREHRLRGLPGRRRERRGAPRASRRSDVRDEARHERRERPAPPRRGRGHRARRRVRAREERAARRLPADPRARDRACRGRPKRSSAACLPDGGLVPPAEFVPHVERTPLVRELTFLVVADALDSAQQWAKAGHDLGVSINIPYRLLDDSQFADGLDRAPPHRRSHLAAGHARGGAVRAGRRHAGRRGDPRPLRRARRPAVARRRRPRGLVRRASRAAARRAQDRRRVRPRARTEPRPTPRSSAG